MRRGRSSARRSSPRPSRPRRRPTPRSRGRGRCPRSRGGSASAGAGGRAATGVPGIVTSTPCSRAAVEREALELCLSRGDRLLEPRADAVQQHPALAVADAAQRLGELGLAAEVPHARVVELARSESAAPIAASASSCTRSSPPRRAYPRFLLRFAGQRQAPVRRGGALADAPGAHRGRIKSVACVASIGRRIATCPPMTTSPASTTRGRAASSRTSRSTSRRRCARAGPCSSSASAPGGSRCRSPRRGSASIGVDPSAGMLEVARERAELAGVDGRPAPRRHARPAGRGRVPARRRSRSARCCTWRPTTTGALALRAVAAAASHRRGASSSTSSPPARTTSPTRTAAGSSASRASGSAPTGTRRRAR